MTWPLGILALLSIYISFQDLKLHKISDRLNFLALTIVILISIAVFIKEDDHRSILIAWLVGFAVFIIFYLLALLSGGSVGGGDVKFAPSLSIGLALINPGWGLLAPMVAFQLAGAAALVLIVFKKRTLMQSIAFAPFLTAGFCCVLIVKLVGA